MINGKLSVIMPAYNESKLIYNSIMTTLDVVSKFISEVEIVAVNDGSKDNTKAEIKRAAAADNRVRLVSSDKNRGKGNAIISGVAHATGEYIAFLDADLELHPAQLESYMEKMLSDNVDVVIGCKFHKDSKIKYPLKRKIISMGYYCMLLVLFHLKVKDTQTGIKLFKASALKPVAHLIRTSGFAYDIELLVALHRRGHSIAQMPVELVHVRERTEQRIGMKDIVKVFKDTWAIFYRVYFKHYYD
ncbi:MAG: glycosyltransferase family 2 protein [Lachnospira sp.]|nr:glycosyltransferase family 2 protein [Lachnospira sp.]